MIWSCDYVADGDPGPTARVFFRWELINERRGEYAAVPVAVEFGLFTPLTAQGSLLAELESRRQVDRVLSVSALPEGEGDPSVNTSTGPQGLPF